MAVVINISYTRGGIANLKCVISTNINNMGSNLVVHDCIHINRDRILGQNLGGEICIHMNNSVKRNHLLRRDIKCSHPHVHLGVVVHTRDDEEDAWFLGTSRKKTTKAEDDCSLIFLRTGVTH